MDPTMISDIAREVVDQQIIYNWRLYLVIIVLSFLGSAVASFITAYLRKRGEHSATKADFTALLAQIAQTTRATEEIKQALAHDDWVAREYKTLRRIKLEDLVACAYDAHHWLERLRTSGLFDGDDPTSPNPIDRLQVIGGLYFPELMKEVAALKTAGLNYQKWIAESAAKVKVAKLKQDVEGHRAALKEASTGFNSVYSPLLSATSDLERNARQLMQAIVSGAS